MYHTARTVAAGSTNRLQSPLPWNRKQSHSQSQLDLDYDLEAGYNGTGGYHRCEESERTPLLFRARNQSAKQAVDPNKVHPVALLLMLALLAFLLLGVVIGVYLLVLQIDHPWPVSYPFFLVERPAWWPYPEETLQATTLDRRAVTDVIVLHTRTAPCANQTDCLRLLQQTEADCRLTRGDHIPYNFLIGADGVTYEARGWKAQHGFEQLPWRNQSLVVGMIGNFTAQQPAEVQYDELKAFLTESIRRLSLAAHYRLLGVTQDDGTNATRSNDPVAMYDQLQRWTHWKGLLRV